MQSEQNLEELIQRFKIVKEAYPKNSYKYISANTIDNFIYHFNKFPIDMKPEIYKSLISYMEYANDYNITSAKQSQQAFEKYLSRTAAQYVRILGFHIFIKPRLLFFVASVIILLLYFLSISIVYYLLVIILVLAIFARQYYYKRQRKVFCPMY